MTNIQKKARQFLKNFDNDRIKAYNAVMSLALEAQKKQNRILKTQYLDIAHEINAQAFKFKTRKTKDAFKIMYTRDPLNEGSVFTISWKALKIYLEEKKINPIGFKITENGIDVFHTNQFYSSKDLKIFQ